MGLNLTLLPVSWWRGQWDSPILAYQRIKLDQDYALYQQFNDTGRSEAEPLLEPRLLPEFVYIQWYDDEGLRKTAEDPYGTHLTYITAEELGKLKPYEVDGPSKWNIAVIKMLHEGLDHDNPIILWWH